MTDMRTPIARLQAAHDKLTSEHAEALGKIDGLEELLRRSEERMRQMNTTLATIREAAELYK